MNLLSLLQEKNIVDASTLAKAKERVEKESLSEEAALLASGVPADTLRNAIGEYYALPSRELSEEASIDADIIRYIPEESAEHYRMLPLAVEDDVLIVGVVDPDIYGLTDALAFLTTKYHMPYRLAILLERDLQVGLKAYGNLTGEVDTVLDALNLEFSEDDDNDKDEKVTEEDIENIKEDAPVTKIVATILRYAVDGDASDIHIEPYESRVNVRFRVDGILVRSLELPKKAHSSVVARIKILSSLRLDERRRPQDGRFSATIDKRKIDFRVSVFPTNHGEKVVLRILDTQKGVRTLEELGVSEHNLKLIRNAIAQPFGIILISGPTGSGKSTTLYAMLSEIDREGKNVLSLEDPVEYDIEGVSQSQVRPEIGYTFAKGLRTALRQDPDVIMVGEIRDKETAQLAIQAALTGHLVLSTIHTNNALGVVPRLLDMGVDPYLIAPTLRLALAQRLLRRICEGTGKKVPIESSIAAMVEHELKDIDPKYRSAIPKSDYLLRAEPSPKCASGTKGRVAVVEAVQVDHDMERLILNGAGEDELYPVARKSGFISMKEDALMKALEHRIPFEEVDTLGGTFVGEEVVDEELAAENITEEEVGAAEKFSEELNESLGEGAAPKEAPEAGNANASVDN
ncbi:type II/IV secretion system protein [Candidatus Parcubacteria bacterium]|uniref:Bacterial type II secretion system protein E domain-containing protein n=1 Tax=Candidatus Kaiserbacteria bacterium CG10_big_fil_rev_8_21_14_0_10_47_16 TaxID=1974608 RepID=A0A2H0UDH3_9BACT|nr:type II/IV secretion system protein [Candidatus Parcubacteria bacterium]PIR84473.1 MAG: hypothetical protein COU16_02745 [Candidatus Kaiserbacteria bacterium CG10_big_fil_rev_8_21_14_0_10_47_16]